MEGVALAAVGLTPVVAGLVLNLEDPVLAMAALVIWAVLVAAVARLAIRPLEELTRRATVQRDLTVTLAEAERVRLAADLHDGPLQDLTLLVRRLDASGDPESAALARSIAAELRDVTGELRLPMLDHLGAGVAMEWLVERVQRLSGDRIDLVRGDVARPPAEVELALFRVAQEALANAVRHGRPPIRVSYRADAEFAALTVEDAGPGIDLGSGADSRHEGRFGLLGMQQRAEQVGARLDLRRRPEGGTQVSLEWRSGLAGLGDAVTIRLAIVDDHPVVRDGTAGLFAAQPDVEVVGVGSTLDEARAMLSATDPPDVLLLDIQLGSDSGLTLLTDERRHTAIVLLTAFDYPQYAAAALQLGAAGFVVKTAPIAELMAAVHAAAAGRLAFDERARGRLDRLTGRELEIARLATAGRSNDEIGRALGIATKTVEAHLGRLYARFDVASRTELAARALREGWLDVPPIR